MEPTACDVLGTRPFLQSGANAVRILLADFRKASGGVVPVLRQGQHHGEQPFGFQRQFRVAQVMVGHHRVVVGFLNSKYRHVITSLQWLKKCSFSGKRRPLCRPDTKPWAAAFRLTVREKHGIFDSFLGSFECKNAAGPNLWQNYQDIRLIKAKVILLGIESDGIIN